MAANEVPADNYDSTLLEEKITWRTDTRKLAQNLQEEGKALVAKIEKLEAIRRGLLADRERAQAEVAELETEIDRLSQENALLKERLEATLGLDAADLTLRAQVYRAEEVTLRSTIADLQGQVNELKDQLIVNRERLVLEDFGFFDYEHPAEDSIKLRVSLDALRTKIKATIKDDEAIQATRNFTFNGSTAKGNTFVKQMSKIMLRAYNAEAENAVASVKAGNLPRAQKRLDTARDQIARQGIMIDLAVTPYYHELRLRELELAARHLQAVEFEKEMERERRSELREQKKVEDELRRAREKLEKERAHYLNSIAKLRGSGDASQADALQVELDRIDDEIVQTENRVANIRAGYVYVISNIGAFGEGVIKIGLTRRLEPMDRVRELGDASVPFTFDVHALFFSDDAVSIEAMLHRHFAERRLNKVNFRREFFLVTPEEVREALAEHKVSLLEFTTFAPATDFRTSWPDGLPTAIGPGARPISSAMEVAV